MAEEHSKKVYVIGGTKVVNEKAPWFKFYDYPPIFSSIALKLIDIKLRKKFGKGIEEFNEKYQIWPMSCGTPRLCVYASDENDAIEKVGEDKELINFLLGLDLGGELEAHPYSRVPESFWL